jgi:hypothetical protein
MLTYKWQGERAEYSQPLESGPTLIISADSIRKERGSCYARVFIRLDDHTLAWTGLNVESDPDRVRLVNSAFKHMLKPDQQALPNAALKQTLDVFSEGLWAAYASLFEAEFMAGDADIAPTEFALEPYIVMGGGTILFAPPGRGKSYSALLMAASIDAGVQTIWRVERPRPILFINLERAKISLRRRVSFVNLALGIEATRPLLFINARGKGLREIEDAARRSVEKHGVEVTFMDSVSRAGLGSLVEDRPANAIIDTLSRICPTWVALAHTPRQDEGHQYGSQMFDAGEDIGLQLLHQLTNNGTLGIGLKMVKANDVPIAPLQVLAYDFDQYGLSGVRAAKRGEFVEIDAQRRTTIQEQIREYLLQVGEASATAVSCQLGVSRQTASTVMAADTCLTRTRQGREILYSMETPLVMTESAG